MDIQPVNTGAGLAEATAESDRRLLERYLARGDEGAFALLVHRHGRIVFHLCRGILADNHDAEDAFQATFLILARKASTVRRQDALASWLCGVARRVALRLKVQRSRRQAREKEVSALPPVSPHLTTNFPCEPQDLTDPSARAALSDDEAVLSEELACLPERYRAPLVLHYLEGKTTERAALQLRCPVGTFKSRLAKARDLMRSRLLRRGVVISSAALTSLLIGSATRAAVPPPLLQATASLPGAPAVSPRAAALARQTLGAMRTPRLVLAGVVLVLVALLGLWLACRGPSSPPPAVPALAPPSPIAAGPTLVVANQKCGTVTLIDVGTGKIRATLAADACPHEVAVSPTGTSAAVANCGPPFGLRPVHTITILDVVAGKTRRTIDLGKYAAPRGIHWLDGDRLLCLSETARALIEIDVAQGRVIREFEAGPSGPHQLAVSAAGKRAYTTHVGSNRVTAFDLAQGVKVQDVEVGETCEGIALSPDGRRLWVGHPTEQVVRVLDAADLRVVQVLPTGGAPFRMAFSPDGLKAVVTQPARAELVVFDTATLREVKRVQLGRGQVKFDLRGPAPGPNAVAIAPGGRVAYCTMFASNAVAVVDLETGDVLRRLGAGLGPDGIAFVAAE